MAVLQSSAPLFAVGTLSKTYSLYVWLQMSEPITHMETDNYMTIHHKGASYFHPTACLGVFCSLV